MRGSWGGGAVALLGRPEGAILLLRKEGKGRALEAVVARWSRWLAPEETTLRRWDDGNLLRSSLHLSVTKHRCAAAKEVRQSRVATKRVHAESCINSILHVNNAMSM